MATKELRVVSHDYVHECIGEQTGYAVDDRKSAAAGCARQHPLFDLSRLLEHVQAELPPPRIQGT